MKKLLFLLFILSFFSCRIIHRHDYVLSQNIHKLGLFNFHENSIYLFNKISFDEKDFYYDVDFYIDQDRPNDQVVYFSLHSKSIDKIEIINITQKLNWLQNDTIYLNIPYCSTFAWFKDDTYECLIDSSMHHFINDTTIKETIFNLVNYSSVIPEKYKIISNNGYFYTDIQFYQKDKNL